MIVSALLRAIPDALLPGVRGLLLLSLLLTLAVFLVLGLLAGLGLNGLFHWLGWTSLEGMGGGALAVLLMLIGGWLLFRSVAMSIVSLFGERIVAAVETAHYPARHGAARQIPFGESLRLSKRSLLRALLGNLLALPAYLALLPTAIGPVILILVLNGYLLGLDLADLLEPRHLAHAPFSTSARWQLGLASAALFLLPVVNLLAPVWSVAMAVHLFHRREALTS